jgi:hypothetical protein
MYVFLFELLWCSVYSRFTKRLFVIALQTSFILCMGEHQGNTCRVLQVVRSRNA